MPRDFIRRFHLKVELPDAQLRFINRALNLIFEGFKWNYLDSGTQNNLDRQIASALGLRHIYRMSMEKYIEGDFLKCLQALEAFYKGVTPLGLEKEISKTIDDLLLESEVDLGIRWQQGRFIKSGAQLLDEELVNKPLHWLTGKKYENVLQPYKKGLEHFLQSQKRPELLVDVITDMYETLEALAKNITGRQDKELSANQELFLKMVKASDAYKVLLKDYIDYANKFRHALKEGEKRPALSVAEVESFVYLTGIFIRLAIVE